MRVHTYSIKYTTHRTKGFRYHFGKGRIMQEVMAELRSKREGVRILGGKRMSDDEAYT